MNRRLHGLPIRSLLLVAILLLVAPIQGKAGKPASARAGAELPDSVAGILDHPTLRGARIGLVVASLPDGEILVDHRGDELFAPASVTKVFTVSTALWRLGPHFAWETPLAYRGTRSDSEIEGDLWVLGRGAPDLVDERLWLAARDLAEDGLERIAGDLVVDDRYFDDERYGKGWPGGSQVDEAYHAPIGALMANFAAHREDGEWRAVSDPAIHFGRVFAKLLDQVGVSVEGQVRRPTPEEAAAHPVAADTAPDRGEASVPPGLRHLDTIRSRPLGKIVLDVNKFSNNVMAETLLKGIGAAEYGPPGTATKGLAVLTRFLDEVVDLRLNSYVQVDGSGLSRLDRYSPRQVVSLLRHAYGDFHLGPELISSLKLGGLDGWNPRSFKEPPLVGELRLKSGHIRGVNTLSGYAHTDSGRTVAFCVMINDHRSAQWQIDQRMAELAEAILATY